MFKSKWQQMYEAAIRDANFWIEHYQHQIEDYAKGDDEKLKRRCIYYSAKLQTWKDVLDDLQTIQKYYIP